MQINRLNQVFSFSLAALVTMAVLAGIDLQAQPKAIDQQLAQVVAPRV